MKYTLFYMDEDGFVTEHDVGSGRRTAIEIARKTVAIGQPHVWLIEEDDRGRKRVLLDSWTKAKRLNQFVNTKSWIPDSGD